MTARIAWLALLAAIALVAVFAQLDRASRFDASLAGYVPPAFSGFAAEQRALGALRSGDPAEAKAAARFLVARRPVPAEHLSLLAFAQAMDGDTRASADTLRAASLRGWREPLAQRAGAEAALIEGQADIASQRIVALLSTGLMREQALDLTARLLASEDGRQAFARRLAAKGRWQANALVPIAGAAEPADLADTLRRAERLNAALDCQALARLAQLPGYEAALPRCAA